MASELSVEAFIFVIFDDRKNKSDFLNMSCQCCHDLLILMILWSQVASYIDFDFIGDMFKSGRRLNDFDTWKW